MNNTFFDKDDVLTGRISVSEPFEIFMCDPWVWISDGCNGGNEKEYHNLDRIYAFLCGDILQAELPGEYQNHTVAQLQKEYSRRFPILFGKALQTIGRQMENDEIRLDIKYPEHEEL